MIEREMMMTLIKIQAPKIYEEIESFEKSFNLYLEEEYPIYDSLVSNEEYGREVFNKIECNRCKFENIIFQECFFKNTTFQDIIFESCDFSNGNFEGAYFKRCLFVSCKGIGTYLQKTIFKQVLFKNSNFRYAYFDEANFKEVWFEDVDLSEASLSKCKLEKVNFTQTKLIKNNFFKTPLKGIDFSNNEFVAPTVSEPPVELRGVIVDRFQAAELAKLMGICIVE